MAVTYLRLFPATNQFELPNGALNVAGQLFVYYSETDDLADIYDENGTQLQQPAILDSNGRAAGLFVNSARVYRLEVCDPYGAVIYNVRNMAPSGGGSGSALGNRYNVTSSDGSIEVEEFEHAGVTTFDIGMAPRDDDEYIEWVKCSDTGVSDGTLIPTYVEGSMETVAAQGLAVQKDKFYHITLSVKSKPTGSRNYYDTLSVKLMYKNTSAVILAVFANDIDSSRTGDVLEEYSYDFKAPADGYIYLIFDGATVFDNVDCCLQVHRVYSGINSVPGSCATKAWVIDYVDQHG